jgi:growth factor-regulated tyrosine kinase substrate
MLKLVPGYKFPPRDLTLANSAMTDTQTAPEWSDSDLCLGCRTPFTFTNRKHHCRNCGQVFDQACSSKTMPLPHYGITQEVRVCDGCFKKLTRKAEQARPPPPAPKKESRRHRPHGQDLEDAELQRAIELSLNETKGYTPSQPPPERWQASEPPIVDRSTRPTRVVDEEDDPDLKAAIEASLREASAPKASAPAPEPTSEYSTYQPTASALPPPPTIPHYELNPVETDSILTFNQTMEQVEAQGGRDLSRYPAVTDLYDKASGLRPKLALSLDDAGRKEGTFYYKPLHLSVLVLITSTPCLELLTDMHSKLSEAVKLYDQILTHQVSQPRWRSAVASPSNAYQPATSGYHSTGYNNQWNAQMQPQATGSTQQTYAPPPPVEQVATQYASMTVSNEPQGQWAPQQQQYIASAPQMTPSAPAPVMSPPPTMIASPPPPPQFTTPSYMQQSAQYSSLPPVTFGQQQPASPIPIPQSPPPPPQQATSPAPSIESQASLTRSNTVAYASGPSVNQGLARSSTLGQRPVPQQYQPLRQQYQQHYQQQQQLHQDQYRQSLLASAPAPPSAVLPSAPTAVPQFGSPYGVEGNQERKEALLIDL